LHPQPLAWESPQHADFAAGAQQEVCSAGPQQAFGATNAGKRSGLTCPDVFSPVSCGRVVIENLLQAGNRLIRRPSYP